MIEEAIIRRVLEWLITETIGKKALEEIKRKAGLDDFTKIGKRTLYETIEGNKNYVRILNSIRENQVFEVKDPFEIDEEEICSIFLEENDKKICHEFLESLKEKYYNIVFELADSNPVTKIIFKKISEHEERLRKVEEYVDKNRVFDIKRIARIQKEIEEETKKIDDFVGRKSIIEDFDPEKPFFVEGKAGIGKTYLLMKLTSLYNGMYIPLKRIKDIGTFKTLVEKATENRKKLFLDDFDYATEEIKDYISAYVWNAVISSRPPLTLKRDISKMIIPTLEKEDIEEYFEIKGILIEKKLLKRLENDLSFPIKLRVFVNFLKSRNITSLDLHRYHTVLEEVGFREVYLSQELEDWYDLFIWADFQKGRYPKGAKKALFVLSLVRTPINIDIISRILEVDVETASDIIESLRAFILYSLGYFCIFHESISKFIRNKTGDLTNCNLKIGDVFSSLPFWGFRWEAMYHYRKARSKDKFEEVFSLGDIEAQIHLGLRIEALENMVFCEINEIQKDDGNFFLDFGVLLLELGEWDYAKEKLKKAMEQFTAKKDRNGMASTYSNLGILFSNQGNWKKAEECYNKSLKIREEQGDENSIAQLYMNIGACFVLHGEWKKAEEYFNKSFEIDKKLRNERRIAKLYMNIGVLSDKRGNWKKAKDYYSKSLRIKEKIGDLVGMAEILGNIGLVFQGRGDWKKAEEYHTKSLKIKEKIGNAHGMAITYANLGTLFSNQGEWKKAEECYNKSLKVLEELGDKNSIAQLYMNIGVCFVLHGEWKKAEEYYNKSLKIEEEIGNTQVLAQIFINIGSLFERQKRWKRAEEYYTKSLKMFEELGDRKGMAHACKNTGSVFLYTKQWKKAEEYYTKSLKIFEELNDKYEIANMYMGMGTFYAERLNWRKAKEYYNKSLKIHNELGNKYRIAQLYMNLGTLLVEWGEYDRVNEHYEEALRLFDKAKKIFMELEAREDVWKALMNELACSLEMKHFKSCINKLSAMFKESYREDLLIETIFLLEEFVIEMERIFRWDIVSEIDETSISAQDPQVKCLLRSISAYGKAKLGEMTFTEFEGICSQIQDEDLLEVLDRIIIQDPT